MTATVTPTQETLFEKLRSFIIGVAPGEVIQGLGNRASMPIGGFISMTPILQSRLSTNTAIYADTFEDEVPNGTKSITQPTEWLVQIDCYGADSQEWANILTTLLRDEYACQELSPSLQPLYADDPKQIPLINGEQQYEQRWMISARFQYNPVTVISQQFFDEAVVEGIHSVDTETL